MNNAHEYSKSISQEVEEIEECLAAGIDIEWDSNILDIEFTVNLRGDVRGVSLLRTVGGPLCLIQFHGNGVALIKTEWGNETGFWSVQAPNLEAAAFELIDVAMSAIV